LGNKKHIPVVWKISALQLDNKTLISGVLLKETPFLYNEQISNFKNLQKVVKTYFIPAYANKKISISADDQTIETTSDQHGSFSVVTDHLINGNLKVKIDNNAESLVIVQTYPILFKTTESPFDIISDIDDTILVSYTADFFKRIATILFTSPGKRKVIDFTQKLFQEIKKYDTRVFYVSKSESNLFAMLTSFIEHNKLPKGKLILTPYLSISQLFHPKKGVNYKLDNIKFILNNTKTKKYVLIGDDSQKDMEVYNQIATEFPERILKIYIRQTKRKILPYQKKMWQKLNSTTVPTKYFDDHSDINLKNEFRQLKNTLL
jgi:phosphatidate phosphatase APP1